MMRTPTTLCILLALVGLTLAGAPRATAGPPMATPAPTTASTLRISYVARDLGNLGDATSGPSTAVAVSSRGLVVGTTRQEDGFERAFGGTRQPEG